jgi:hypothetical protein
MLQVAASTQGVGAAIPDLGSLLPNLPSSAGGGSFVDSYAASLTAQLGAKVADAEGCIATLEAILDSAASVRLIQYKH